MTAPVELTSLSLEGMEALVARLGQPSYRAKQLYRWVYHSDAASVEAMSNLPAALRSALASETTLARLALTHRVQSRDQTIKLLFRLSSGRHVESVLIPDFATENDRYGEGPATRLTVCVSSQVGCAMACSFCATGRMGFHQNLTAGEILEQVVLLDALAHKEFGRGVSNVVYMGMGEPLQNYQEVVRSVHLLRDEAGLGLSARRITISTVGLARRIRQLADDEVPANLAISLHAPDDTKRSSIMPVNRAAKTDLTALRDAVRHYASTTGKPVTYEYCMFSGFNDSVEDARNLARVCRWAPSKVNLIMYNPVPGLGFDRTEEKTLNAFIRVLVDGGVRVTVRRSRGQDIAAACGQLAAETD
ncbi:MAG: 23S rRNA (adenine(2503)-C(2))-methyltransferase RlmN [Rhodothermales bacterium]|nr:23S rRNA (adenine(2503)-C(2))-methyltransferase RlmN [Rhodothermales bacterium]MBO6781288.1 23S rRNA (adenine(2503)-C(2))-methyltransferase RlmN [Rhodothermales bacterium]